MSTDTVSPLRQRMIEGHERAQSSVPARRGPYPRLQRFGRFSSGPPKRLRPRISAVSVDLPRPALSICTANRFMTGLGSCFA